MNNLYFRPGKLLAFLLLLNLHGMAQYVTLEGRQFKLGGNDFYPLVCNYSFEIIFNSPDISPFPSLSQLYLSPSRNYGNGYPGLAYLPNNHFDYDTDIGALAQIDADFQKISDMGFNAIRTHGITANMYNSPTGNFYYEIIPNYHSVGPSNYYPTVRLEPLGTTFNYATNPQLAKLWDFYDIIFTKAQAHGLKVLLDVAGGTIGSNSLSSHHSSYNNYLAALADHFKNNTALMAYVVIEEPDLEANNNTGNTKKQICTYTTEWYDAIKGNNSSPNDQNHLVTASCVFVGCVFEWDPGVMKLDFFSPHLYPGTESFEGNSTIEPYYRTLGFLQWLRDNCPMPWITGETGFSACDDSYFTNTLPTWAPNPLSPPDDFGDLSDQLWFADNILDEVRNAGGSGFSWWNYQENWWPSPGEEGYGLIDHSGNDKPVVGAFTGYLNSTTHQPPSASFFNAPANYYNPYNTGSVPVFGYNSTNDNTINGDVYDANTMEGIKDAYIFAWNWLATDIGLDGIPHTLDDHYTWSAMHTFTDASGHFQIIPYNFLQPTITDPHRIVKIRVSATGAERAYDGPWDDIPFFTSTILLDRNSIEYDALVQNLTVNPGIKNFRGRNTLTASDVIVLSGANSDFTARNQITINPYFEANSGSEVHIFTSEFQECPTYNFYAKMGNQQISGGTTSLEENERTIEIAFTPKSKFAYMKVKPNPGKGMFFVEFASNETESSKLIVKIYDMMGSKIYESTEFKNNFIIDLSNNPIGVYALQITSRTNSINQKIIIN